MANNQEKRSALSKVFEGLRMIAIAPILLGATIGSRAKGDFLPFALAMMGGIFASPLCVFTIPVAIVAGIVAVPVAAGIDGVAALRDHARDSRNRQALAEHSSTHSKNASTSTATVGAQLGGVGKGVDNSIPLERKPDVAAKGTSNARVAPVVSAENEKRGPSSKGP